MVAKSIRVTVCCLLFSYTALSYAGIERFWTFFNDSDEVETQIDDCENLTQAQQQQLIQNYQSLRDDEKKLDLKKRMQWFCQLPDDQQQLMREAWQNMSTTQRKDLRKQLETASTAEQRALIRQEFLIKYALEN